MIRNANQLLSTLIGAWHRGTPKATEEELSAKELRDLSKRLEDANGYMAIIAENIEGIRSELSWLLDNREQVLPMLIQSMSKDPCSRDFKINAANQKPAETIACAECDIDSPDSLAAALNQGWIRLQQDFEGLGHNYLGICPDCSKKEESPASANEPPKPEKKKPGSLF